MNALNRTKTFYENSLDKRILEQQENSNDFNLEEFLIFEFKAKIKFTLEYEIADFNAEVTNELKNNLGLFKQIFSNYNLGGLYNNKEQYTKEAFEQIFQETENYTYVWNPIDIPSKISEMQNKVINIQKKYWF